ncbi:agamous-like MADS-box protein AGL80 [Abrus precatorius]|uniref:Agamous-like MADS-box protein AGL80 n=1 Tax=Abrus precatorius TaxID=3816 RepID=A0A8B8K152_ABRPR|nr:agamous-like MADS-box protein AGL80 [Abrus precatorius]
MTRKKVKLAFIANESARKATYKKRKKGLVKKIDELSTLCGIEACAVIYGPYDPEPEVWPSSWGVQRVLAKFRTMPELEQSKKMVNQESFLNQRIMKGKEQMKKQVKDNREKEMAMLMFQCLSAGMVMLNNMTMIDLNDLTWLIDKNLRDIGRRLETTMNVQEMTPYQPQMATPTLEVAKNEEMALMDHGHGNAYPIHMQRNWFMNLLNGNNGNETTMPQFGDANIQSGFWPNLLP